MKADSPLPGRLLSIGDGSGISDQSPIVAVVPAIVIGLAAEPAERVTERVIQFHDAVIPGGDRVVGVVSPVGFDVRVDGGTNGGRPVEVRRHKQNHPWIRAPWRHVAGSENRIVRNESSRSRPRPVGIAGIRPGEDSPDTLPGIARGKEGLAIVITKDVVRLHHVPFEAAQSWADVTHRHARVINRIGPIGTRGLRDAAGALCSSNFVAGNTTALLAGKPANNWFGTGKIPRAKVFSGFHLFDNGVKFEVTFRTQTRKAVSGL